MANSYKKNAIELFKKNLGKPVTSQQLALVQGKSGQPISHNIRRIFELRDEDGYNIVNHRDNERTGLNLKIDEWMLLDPEPDEERVKARGVNKRIRAAVFERDKFACVICGRTPKDDDPVSPGKKIVLHVGHNIAHKRKGDEIYNKVLTIDDFSTMCSVCNEGYKNKDYKPITLLDRVKDADSETKNEIYDYLSKELTY